MERKYENLAEFLFILHILLCLQTIWLTRKHFKMILMIWIRNDAFIKYIECLSSNFRSNLERYSWFRRFNLSLKFYLFKKQSVCKMKLFSTKFFCKLLNECNYCSTFGVVITRKYETNGKHFNYWFQKKKYTDWQKSCVIRL